MNFISVDGNQIRMDRISSVSVIDKLGGEFVSIFYFTVGTDSLAVFVKRSEDKIEELRALRASVLVALAIDEQGGVKPSKGESITGYRRVDAPEPQGFPTPIKLPEVIELSPRS